MDWTPHWIKKKKKNVRIMIYKHKLLCSTKDENQLNIQFLTGKCSSFLIPTSAASLAFPLEVMRLLKLGNSVELNYQSINLLPSQKLFQKIYYSIFTSI